MIDQVVGHVVRRGMDAYSNASEDPTSNIPQIPAWGGVVLIVATVLFAFALVNVEYTFGHVIATLSMIESPSEVLFSPLPSDEVDAPPPSYEEDVDSKDTKDSKMGLLQSLEPELLIVKQKPVTATLKNAMAELNKGGLTSRFRGLGLYVIHGLLTGWMTSFLTVTFLPRPVAAIFSAVIFSRLRMQWTHVVMASTSSKPWFRRVLSAQGIKAFQLNALPTALLAVCEQATVALPILFFYTTGMDTWTPESLKEMPCTEHKLAVLKVFGLVMLCLFSAVAIVIPAQVTLTRVQASMFSEREETIVPFDRSFAGKVVVRSEGGSGIVGVLDAWRSFGWAARARLLKLYVKVAMLQVGVMAVYAFVVVGLLASLVGEEDREKLVALFGEDFNGAK